MVDFRMKKYVEKSEIFIKQLAAKLKQGNRRKQAERVARKITKVESSEFDKLLRTDPPKSQRGTE
jgi:hypothetical protein